MATVKVTFTLDEGTVRKLNEAARMHRKPKSLVVREAIGEYHNKKDRVSEAERRRMLAVLDNYLKQPATRAQSEVERELRDLRRARRSGGRLHPAE